MFTIEDFEEEIYYCIESRKDTENCIFLYNDLTFSYSFGLKTLIPSGVTIFPISQSAKPNQ